MLPRFVKCSLTHPRHNLLFSVVRMSLFSLAVVCLENVILFNFSALVNNMQQKLQEKYCSQNVQLDKTNRLFWWMPCSRQEEEGWRSVPQWQNPNRPWMAYREWCEGESQDGTINFFSMLWLILHHILISVIYSQEGRKDFVASNKVKKILDERSVRICRD